MLETTQQQAVRTIRLHLANSGKPQAWLAKRLGVTPHWLYRRMRSNGRIAFSTDDLDRIAEVFGIEPLELLVPALEHREVP